MICPDRWKNPVKGTHVVFFFVVQYLWISIALFFSCCQKVNNIQISKEAGRQLTLRKSINRSAIYRGHKKRNAVHAASSTEV